MDFKRSWQDCRIIRDRDHGSIQPRSQSSLQAGQSQVKFLSYRISDSPTIVARPWQSCPRRKCCTSIAELLLSLRICRGRVGSPESQDSLLVDPAIYELVELTPMGSFDSSVEAYESRMELTRGISWTSPPTTEHRMDSGWRETV